MKKTDNECSLLISGNELYFPEESGINVFDAIVATAARDCQSAYPNVSGPLTRVYRRDKTRLSVICASDKLFYDGSKRRVPVGEMKCSFSIVAYKDKDSTSSAKIAKCNMKHSCRETIESTSSGRHRNLKIDLIKLGGGGNLLATMGTAQSLVDNVDRLDEVLPISIAQAYTHLRKRKVDSRQLRGQTPIEQRIKIRAIEKASNVTDTEFSEKNEKKKKEPTTKRGPTKPAKISPIKTKSDKNNRIQFPPKEKSPYDDGVEKSMRRFGEEEDENIPALPQPQKWWW